MGVAEVRGSLAARASALLKCCVDLERTETMDREVRDDPLRGACECGRVQQAERSEQRSAVSTRNSLEIVDGSLVITPRGLDRLWGLRKQLTVPLAQITDVQVEYGPGSVKTGWRYPGLQTLNKLSGTFHPGNQQHYWNYAGPGEALMIEVGGGYPFQRLYLSVADAEGACRMLREAAALGADGVAK